MPRAWWWRVALAVSAGVRVVAERVSDVPDGGEAPNSPNASHEVMQRQQHEIGSLRAEVESLRAEAKRLARSLHEAGTRRRIQQHRRPLEMHDAVGSYAGNATCRQVELHSQEDVQAFGELHCRAVQRLLVTGNVTDLLPLQDLRQVAGYFRITRTQVSSLYGLGNLLRVGHLVITENQHLLSLRGIGNFSANELVIESNDRMESFDGLQPLKEIGGRLEIFNNSNLRSLSVLSNLRKIGGFMNVGNNRALVSLDGLQGLKEVWGNVNILNNEALQTLQGLSNLNIVGCVTIALNTHMEYFGGLFAYSASNAVINSLSIDNASMPKCATTQEWRFLSSPELYRDPNKTNVPKASPDTWQNNSCGPGAYHCWLGKPCLVNLSAVSYTGGVGMTNRTCAECDGDDGLAIVGSDHMVNITEYLLGRLPGDYTLCRCVSEEVGSGPLVPLSFYGHAVQQNFTCVRGSACSLHLPGHGLSRMDSLLLMRDCTGVVDGRVNYAFRDDAGVYHFSERKKLAAVMPGLYKLCWEPPHCEQEPGVACPKVEIGTLRVQGPLVRDDKEVKPIGKPFSVPNDGDGVGDHDYLMLLRTCGQEGVALDVANKSDKLTFWLSMDLKVPVTYYRKCWCQVSPTMPCNKSEHFMADMGGVKVVCPSGTQTLSSDKHRCEECPVGRQKIFLEEEYCTLSHQYVLIMGVAIFSLFVAFHLGLNDLRQPIVIDDVFRLGDKTMIKTVGQHGLRMYSRGSFPVFFAGTTNPQLDSPKETFRACKHSKNTLELLSHKESSIDGRLDTSRGVIQISLATELWHHGWPFPLVVSIALLVTTFALVSFVAGLDPLHLIIGVAIALAAALLIYSTTHLNTRVGELQKRLDEFLEELRSQNPDPCPCEKGPSRAIQLVKLFEIVDFFHPFIRDRNAYYMDGNIFGPLTAPDQLSYAELVGPRNVEWFVSHYWGHGFIHFYDSLRKHAELVSGPHTWHQVAYWICFCSNNQYQIKHELGSSWEESSFFLALNSGLCRGVCMVLDDLAVPLTRSWCIFELLQTLKLERQKSDFGGLMLSTAGGVLNSGQGSVEVAMNLARKVATLDLQHASASCESDKAMINAQVVKELGSFRAMNTFIREKMFGILQEAQGETSNIFENLFRTMKSSIDGPDDTDSDEGSPVSGPPEPPSLD